MNHYLKISFSTLLFLFILCPAKVSSQVQVRDEPKHRLTIQNEYIRLLDVWIEPGDTSLFHIHNTPSVFTYLSNSIISVQVKGQGWITDTTTAGKAWYNGFPDGPMIHRVCDNGPAPLHVIDVELLAPYVPDSVKPYVPLNHTILFENERVNAYRVTNPTFLKQNARLGKMCCFSR